MDTYTYRYWAKWFLFWAACLGGPEEGPWNNLSGLSLFSFLEKKIENTSLFQKECHKEDLRTSHSSGASGGSSRVLDWQADWKEFLLQSQPGLDKIIVCLWLGIERNVNALRCYDDLGPEELHKLIICQYSTSSGVDSDCSGRLLPLPLWLPVRQELWQHQLGDSKVRLVILVNFLHYHSHTDDSTKHQINLSKITKLFAFLTKVT